MGRIRTIKPEAPQSESLGRVCRDSRLLFFMLFTLADDEGRARANSRMLASLLFPYDDDAPNKIPEWLMELEREHCIKVYQIDGNIYLQIINWLDHQKIDKPTKSKLPAPPFLARSRERSRKSREPSSLDQGREGIKEGIKEQEARERAVVLPEWLPSDVWKDFLDHRQRLRAPMTRRAQELAIAELERLRADGADPIAAIERSISQGWKGIFNDEPGGNRPAGRGIREAAQRALDEIERGKAGESGAGSAGTNTTGTRALPPRIAGPTGNGSADHPAACGVAPGLPGAAERGREEREIPVVLRRSQPSERGETGRSLQALPPKRGEILPHTGATHRIGEG